MKGIMNINEFSKILANTPSERSIASEILKAIIKKTTTDEMDILIDEIPNYRKNIYSIIYDEYICRLETEDIIERDKIDNIFIEKMNTEKTYLHKIRLANYFEKLSENEITYSEKNTLHLMDNSYYSIRRIGYENAKVKMNDLYMDKLIENNKKYNDDILEFLLKYELSEETKELLVKYLEEYYSEEYEDYIPFEDMITRNNILVKLEKYETEKIENLKEKDPLSYVFILKTLKRNTDSDYLLNVFYSFNPRKLYLIRWFGELGNIEVINKIFEKEYISPSPSMAMEIVK
jgi:hypothetical protein